MKTHPLNRLSQYIAMSFCAVLLCANTAMAAGTNLSVSSPTITTVHDLTASVGQTLSVAINADNDQSGIYGIQFILNYDKTLLTFAGITVGNDTQGWSVAPDSCTGATCMAQEGTLIAGIYNNSALATANGQQIAVVKFTVKNTTSSPSPLTLVPSVVIAGTTYYTLFNETAATKLTSGTFSTSAATFTVMANTGVGGTVAPASIDVVSGANQDFTITPSAGYAVSQVKIDNNAWQSFTGTTYTLTNVTAIHNVAVSFTPITNAMTISAGSNGSISPTTATIAYGGSQVFTVTPSAGYTASVTVDGTPVTLTGNTYTLSNVTAVHTIAATFFQNSYNMIISAGSYGTISPTTANIAYGGSQVFTVTPATGYTATVTDNGNPVTLTGNTYTLSNVTSVHTISASFAQNVYEIIATSGSGGTVNPSVMNTPYGGNVSFRVTPDTNYYIASVTDNGIPVTLNPDNTYGLTNVTASHLIEVSFSINFYNMVISAGSNGSIFPTTASIMYGGSRAFTVTPATGYTASVTVDGTPVTLTGNIFLLSNVTAVHTIAVTFSQNSYNMTITAGSNGSISPTTANIAYGGNQVFTVTPATGYTATVTDNGSPVALTGNTYTLSNVTAVHTIAATFTQNTYNMTISAGTHGSISPTTANITYGGSQVFTVAAATGYTASLTDNGSPVTLTGNDYTLSNVTAVHTIVASFSINTFNMTISAGAGGTISPLTATVNYGASQVFTVTPNTGYTAVVTDNGTPVTMTGNTYTLSNVTAVHTIAVTFTQNTYTMNISAGSHGTITPSTATIAYGGSQIFTLAPSLGYTATLTDNGTPVTLTGNTYTLNNVTAIHTLVPSFTLLTNAITVNAGSNGTVSPSSFSIGFGNNQTFTVTPSTGYTASVTDNGVPVTLTGNTFSLSNVIIPHIIAATFSQNTYALTASAGSNGTITPTSATIAYGNSQVFTVIPATGYTASVTDNGTPVALTGGAYTVSNVTGIHTIAASFSQNTYDLTASAGSNGTIAPTSVNVAYGNSQVFTITPATGYTATLTDNGSPVTLTGNTYALSNVTGVHAVVASFSQITNAVTASAGANGTIAPTSANVVYGGNQVFTLSPGAGYTASLTDNGSAVTLAGNTYTLSNITSVHTLAASFTQNTYSVTAGAGSNGTITPTSATVAYGGNQVFTVTPATGYTPSITDNGVAVTMVGNTYTLSNVVGVHAIAANFTQNTYNMAISAGSNGSISPTTATIAYGGSQVFTITPATGYTAHLTDNGTVVSMTGNSYTLSNVTGIHTIAASFIQNTYGVTASAGANGSISPLNATIAYGNNQVFTITPSTGYTATVTDNGTPVTLTGNTYTLTNVTGVHTIAANFTQNTYDMTISAGSNGSISPTTATIAYGGSQVFTLSPSTGYTAHLTDNGNPVAVTGNTYTLSNVTGAHSLVASFSLNTYNMAMSVGSNGSISPTTANISYGGSQAFTVDPNVGYTASVTDNGAPVTLINNAFTLSNVTGIHTIVATFSQNTYNLTASAGANGTIAPTTATIAYGGSQVFTLSPSAGYTASVTDNGTPVTVTNNTYTLSNVTGVHNVVASFSQNTYDLTASAGSNGTIAPTTATIAYGGSQVFTVSPSVGYTASVKDNGTPVALTGNSYTLTNVTGIHNIVASFSLNSYAITVNADSHGAITPTSANVSYGGNQTFTVTPGTGYNIGSVTDNGSAVTLTGNTYTLSNVTAVHTIAASFTQITNAVTASAGSNGSIIPISATVVYGASQAFTVNPSVGYAASVTDNGTPVTLTGNTYTLNNVVSGHAIAASFTQIMNAVTVSSTAGGTISPTGTMNVTYGANQAFTIIPNTGYTAQLKVDGTAVTMTGNTYTLSNITNAHSVAASFTPITNTVTATAGTGGSISPSGDLNVAYGGTQVFTVVTNPGYTSQLTVDGVAVALSNNSYTLSNIVAGHTVTVNFAHITNTVTATTGANGSITPLGTMSVIYGASQTYTVTPNDGYVPQMVVDGAPVTLGVDNTYTLSNVTSSHTVSVSFDMPPVANMVPSVTSGTASLLVAFTAIGSSDPDGVITSYNWNFGDGSSSTDAITTHTYGAGTFTATLTVTDDKGLTSSVSRGITATKAVSFGKKL